MEKKLKEFLSYPDEIAKTKMLSMIKRFYLLNSAKSSQRVVQNHINEKHQISYKYRKDSRTHDYHNKRRNTEPFSIKHSLYCTPKNKISSYELESFLNFQNTFNKLYDQYNNTEWVQNKSEKNCNILIIKQFFFDSGVCESNFYKMLMENLKGKDWITSDDFLVSLEYITNHSKKANNIRLIKRHQEINLIQKLLCNFQLVFFQIIRFLDGEDLCQESLEKALYLALVKSKIAIQQIAEKLMNSLLDSQIAEKPKISFIEFYRIIVNDQKIFN